MTGFTEFLTKALMITIIYTLIVLNIMLITSDKETDKNHQSQELCFQLKNMNEDYQELKFSEGEL